jgi:hypothetical protein
MSWRVDLKVSAFAVRVVRTPQVPPLSKLSTAQSESKTRKYTDDFEI